MTRKKSSKPEFYSCFMEKGFFPNANKITKYQESHNYWIFKTGERVYKVKKKEPVISTISLEEVFCNEAVQQIQQHSPELKSKTVTVKKQDEKYILDFDESTPSTVLYFAISMNQLKDRGFLDNIILKGKLTDAVINQISKFLSQYHNGATTDSSKIEGSPDKLASQIQDLFYQSKKYTGVTISQAIIDMTLRPLEKYLKDNRKLLLRRVKSGFIKRIHGDFIPRKIHIDKNRVQSLGKTIDPIKKRYNDIASDIADLSVELNLSGNTGFTEQLVNQYSKHSGDKELKQVLPFYQAMRCLFLGLTHSIKMKNLGGIQGKEEQKLARTYYEQTINIIREI